MPKVPRLTDIGTKRLLMALIASALRCGDETFLGSPFCQRACLTHEIDLPTMRREYEQRQEAHV